MEAGRNSLRFQVTFDGVESLSEHSPDRRDGKERIRIYLLDVAQKEIHISLSGEHHKNRGFLLGVPSFAVKNGHSTVELGVNHVRNLIELPGDDEDLDALP